jgi:hypothetical protein
MAHRLAIELACGVTARLNTRAPAHINVVTTAGKGLQQRVTFGKVMPLASVTVCKGGLSLGGAFLALNGDEFSAVIGFLRLAGWTTE